MKMKIAFLKKEILSGPNRTQYQRALYFSYKHDVFIFVDKNSNIPRNFEIKTNIVRSPINFSGLASFLYPIWCIYKVWSLNKKINFDVVYSQFWFETFISAFILKALGLTWIADIYDHPELPLEVMQSKRKSIKELLLFFSCFIGTYIGKGILKYADIVIAAIHPEALKQYHIDGKKIFEVTNGVDLALTKVKETQKTTNDKFKIFYLGYVMPSRGLYLLLLTVKLLKRKINNFELNLVGNADEEDKFHLYEIINKLNIEKEVNYLGRLKHDMVLNLLESSDVCVFPFPRKKELDCIYPIKIFEYMAMGKAIIATQLKGISKILKDGEDALLVKPDNPKDMVNAILCVYNNHELKKKLEINARLKSKHYDWNKINAKIDERIKKLILREKNSKIVV